MKLVLASASPRRREILNNLGYDFTVRPSNAEEIIDENQTPAETVESLASQKAQSVALSAADDEIVLGADTVVVYDGKILGKPRDKKDAENMLHMLSGKTHEVYTGVCLADRNGVLNCFSVCTKVKFYPLSDDEITRYIDSGEPMDKAGSYGIQGKGCYLIEGIEGDYFNVVGLPAARTARALNLFNVLNRD